MAYIISATMEMAMLKIDGQQIRERRDELGLTLDQLSAKAGINRKTIHQIEKAKRKRGARKSTLEALAKALEMDVKDPVVYREKKSDESPAEYGHLVQINVRLPRDVRNSWSLLALRYGIAIKHLIEMAPIAFFLIAEGSLHHRRQRLEELKAQMRRMDDLRATFPDWPSGIVGPEPALDDALFHERASIEARDLFARKVFDSEAFDSFVMPEEWYDEGGKPFTTYVREQSRVLDLEAELDCLDGGALSPSYRVCLGDIRRLVGADEEAVDAISEGWVLLHEMPKELLRNGPAEQRATWVKEKLATWRRESPAFLGLELSLVEETR
jgi:transcriptional regulator with XRE-family HTH domain